MFDLATIRHISNEAARAARRARKQPLVLTEAVVAHAKQGAEHFSAACSIPNLGVYVPAGWKRLSLTNLLEEVTDRDLLRGFYEGDADGHGAYFVDKGFDGSDDEPAIPVDRLLTRTLPALFAFIRGLGFRHLGIGVGLVEEGQFQVKLGFFYRPVRRGA